MADKIGITIEALYDGDQAKKGLKGLSNDLKRISGISRLVVKPEIDTSDALKSQKQAIKNYYAAIEKEIGRGINLVNSKGGKVKLGAFQYLNGKDEIKDIVNVNDLKKAADSFSKIADKVTLAKAIRERAATMQNLYSGYYNRIVDLGQGRIDQRRFEAKQRTRQQNRTLDAEDLRAQAANKVLSIEKQISREKYRNMRGGGDVTASLYRQIELYHKLAAAQKAAGNDNGVKIARKHINELNTQIKGVERLNTLFGRQGRIMTGLQSVAARYFSIYTVANFAKQVAETTGYFQQQQVALEGILGSAAKARDTLAEIKNFALQSPFQTKELVTFTKQLAAFGVGNNDLFPTVKKLADISAGLGVDMSRIILAYGQVKSAAVLRGQELRQFTEAGIPMVQKLADKFTELNGKLVTTGEVFKLISERQVPFEMVAQVLSDMTAEGGQFYKMQENITDTTYGQIQKLKDLWTIAMDDMGKAAEGPINTIIKGLQNIVKNIQPIATAIASSVIFSALGKLLTSAYRIIKALKAMRIAALGAKGVLSGMGGAFGLFVGAIAGLTFNALKKQNELRDSMNEVAKAYDKDTRRMISGLDNLTKKINSSAIGTKAYNDALSTLSANYGEFISNSTIKALQGEGEAARKAADDFAELAETLKIVIRRQQEYNQLEEQGKTAAELAGRNTGERATSSLFLNNLLQQIVPVKGSYGTGKVYDSELLPGVKEFLSRNSNVTEEVLLKAISGIIENALIEAAELGYDNNTKKGKHALKKLFADRIKEAYNDLSPDAIGDIVNNAMSMADWKTYEESRNYYSAAAATTQGKISKPFKDLDRRLSSGRYNVSSAADSIDKEVAKEGEVLKALIRAMAAANIPMYKGSKVEELINNASTDDEAFAYNILQALEGLKTGRTTDEITNISSIMRMFSSRIGVRSGHAARIADRFRDRNSIVGRWRGNDNLANLVATFGNPADDTYENLRNQLQVRKSEVQKAIEDMTKGPYHADDLKRLKEQLDAITILQSDEYYGIEDRKRRKGGSGSGGGWRRMFTDLFGWIKEAREEEKKLVEFSAGTTGALGNQIYSDQLKDTAVRAFWDDGSPFQKFINKMDEYGIESEVFNKDFLQNQLSGIVTKQIEATGTVNYEDVWEQLIGIINTRADELKGNSKMASTFDAIKNYLAQMTIEGEKFFGRNRVEKLIEDQLKELRRINSHYDAMQSRRDMRESIAGASNFMQAQQALYGGGRYTTAFASDITRMRLRDLLGGDVGKGISELQNGIYLKDLVEGGNLGINSLYELSSILEGLHQDINKLPQDSNEYKEMNGVIGTFDSLIKKLMEDIIKEFEELMKLKDPLTAGMDSLAAAGKQFINATDRIKAGEAKGDLDKEVAKRMRIEALQALYGSATRSLGGNGMQSYINRIYGTAEGNTGVTERGYGLGMWLNDGTFIEKMVNARIAQSGITREQFKTNEEYEEALKKVTEEVLLFAANMELAGAIIAKVDSYIQKSAQFANDLIDALEATNGLVLDENGNPTYANDYDTAKQAISTIAELSSGISGAFQSLLSGDVFGAIMSVGSTIAKFFSNLFGIGDSQIQKQQDKIISSNKSLERAITNLQHSIQDLAGKDKWDNLTEQISNLRQQEENNMRLYSLEMGKKHGDSEKALSSRDAAEENAREAENIVRSIREEIFGTADELATTLTDAMVTAFRNGENAARAWRDTVRSYVGDVLKDVLMEKVLAPRIDQILKKFGIEEGNTNTDDIMALFMNPNRMLQLRNELFGEETNMQDWFNSLPKVTQEMIAWNSNTSALSGGIQGITEDTARTLEGLSNSMLAQLVLIQRSVSLMEGSGFAQVQVSWFNDMLNQQRAIRAATEGVNNAIAEMRNGIRPIAVQVQ